MAAAITDKQVQIVVNPDDYQLNIDGQSERIDPLIMRLLLHLYENQGQVVTRQALSELVWLSSHTSDEAINRGVSRLRKLLGPKRDAFIKTVPKQGYQFTLPKNVSICLSNESLTPNQPTKTLNEQPPTNDLLTEPVQTLVATPVTLQDGQQLNTASHTSASNSAGNSAGNSKSKAPNRLLRQSLFIMAVVITCLIGITIKWPSNDTSLVKNPQKPTVLPTKLPISLPPIKAELSAGLRSNTAYAQSLHTQLKTELTLTNKFDFAKTNNNANPYVINITILSQPTKLLVTVDIKNKQQNVSHFSQLEFSPDVFEHNKVVVNEIAAFTRLMLIYTPRNKRLLKAYDPLSYYEVEQLIKVSKSGWFIYDQVPHHYQTVSKLQQKYPDVAQVNGMMSLLNHLRASNFGVDTVVEKNLQLKNALKALRVSPSNFDGLRMAFIHNLAFPQYRAKSVDYANSMQTYHPNQPRSWRNQLMLMIHNQMPCDKIAAYVNTFPNGLFKPHRLAVIEQILTACLNQTPPQDIYKNLSFVPNNIVDTAIINNTKLFFLRHDQLWKPDNRYNLAFNGLHFYLNYLEHQMMRTDTAGASSFLQKIQDSNSRYWQWRAQIYLSLYDDPVAVDASAQEQLLWRDDFLSVFQEEADLYFAASMIKHGDNSQNAQRIEQYLQHRPSFNINVINRKESIARIMLLHRAGRLTQAKTEANQLYRQLSQNYQTSPNSFRFWNLGRYHLLAKLYCGQNCETQSLTPKQYLDKMFSPHHIWWLDDLQFMTIALSPWSNSAIAKTYLQKLTIDIDRMQQKLGIQ